MCYAESRDGGFTFEKPPLRGFKANWNGPDVQYNARGYGTEPMKMTAAELRASAFKDTVGGYRPDDTIWRPCWQDVEARHPGTADANIMMKGGYVMMPTVDYRPGVPASERYKAIVTLTAHGGDETFRGFTSPDGLTWTIGDAAFGGNRDDISHARSEIGHALDGSNIVLWDERVGEWVAFVRLVESWNHRSFGHALSGSWTSFDHSRWRFADIQPPYAANEGIYAAAIQRCPTPQCRHLYINVATRVRAGTNSLAQPWCRENRCEHLRSDVQILVSADIPGDTAMTWPVLDHPFSRSPFPLRFSPFSPCDRPSLCLCRHVHQR